MIALRIVLPCLALFCVSCSTGPASQLKNVKVDLEDEKIDGGIDKAVQSYQRYLDRAPKSDATPESILRLADLKIQNEFDFSDKQIISGGEVKSGIAVKAAPGGSGGYQQSAGTREAIDLYNKLLTEYPRYEHNDHALYQLARINEELGNVDEAIITMGRLVKDYPRSHYIEEVQLRRGEYYYARKQFAEAKEGYGAIVDIGTKSSYFELALYKLGWTYYKQEMYEEGLHQFFRLFDYKVATGYDLDHPKDSFDEKRIEDTYRAMSLSFTYLGGPDAVAGYFGKFGKRPDENRVYKNLGDYYLEMHRYSDAAATFRAFVKSNPYHKLSPYFDMWAIDSYRKGGFPKLVVEANKEFVGSYGLQSPYWKRFDIASFGDVSGYVKTSLKELANLHHAQYQDANLVGSKNENFQEAVKWYREFIISFKKDEDAPAVHNQLAELLLENKSYGEAAIEFEHVAYDYPSHKKSSEAGYTAIYALRKSLANAAQEGLVRARHDVVRSSLKFADAFPKNEKASIVLGAAVDDIYGLKEYAIAATTSKKLLTRYAADQPTRRAAWTIFAHSSFELGNLKDAEEGYSAVLKLTAENDPARAGMIENLAASLYKQGDRASKQGNCKSAAVYFLSVATSAPTARIRPAADFDGITALIECKDLVAAANALRSYREHFPGQPQAFELNKKLAFAYREAGSALLAAVEYEKLAAETRDAEFQRAALELAGDMYAQDKKWDQAYLLYRRYLSMFPKPLEDALEMHSKIAAYLKTRSDMRAYLSELREIMEGDAKGGAERTDRTRYLGSRAALDLAEFTIRPYAQIKLENPFEENLRKKQEAMRVAKEQLEKLFDYETDVVTSAATYYLAEMYYDFSKALNKSERPYSLTEQEREQYELSIEEQAYPFEEKAIQVHQKNLDLMTRGIYNAWIEKSIDRLAKIVPARYAKFEESSGYIRELEKNDYTDIIDPKRLGSNTSATVIRSADGSATNRKLSRAQRKEMESDFSEAMQSLTLAQFAKSTKLLGKVIEQSPNNPVPYVNLALIYEKTQNLALAEESLRQAVKIAPENPVVNNEYALLLRKTAKFAEARRVYEKVLERYPNFLMARKNLGILCDLYMKDYQCALKHYGIFSSSMPDDATVKNWIASIQGR